MITFADELALLVKNGGRIEIGPDQAEKILSWRREADPDFCHECEGEEMVEITGDCVCGRCESPPEAKVPCPKCNSVEDSGRFTCRR